MSVATTSTLSDKCSDMLYKARCVKALNEGYYLPTMEFYEKQSPPATLQSDPVNIAWNILRQGGLLCTLLNEYRGNTIDAKKITPLPADGSLGMEHFGNRQAQNNVKMFVAACRDELFIQSDELFDPADLYTENMNTLNKALAFTEKFYDKLKRVKGVKFKSMIEKMKEEEAAAMAVAGGDQDDAQEGNGDTGEQPITDKRLRAIQEILTSERAYVSDLDHLFKYFEELKIDKVIPSDVIARIFANFEELTNFQQRYSYLVESTINKATLKDVASSYEGHIFKKLFIDQEAAFEVYMKYVANLPTARALVKENMEALMSKRHVMDPQGQLDSFLIKPTQRLCKYPLLIREVIRNSAKDAPDLPELEEAYKVGDRNAARVNELLAEGENEVEAGRMKELVTDWTLAKKPIDKDGLGPLRRYEKLNYIKDTSQAGTEVSLYLFQNRLLMCRPGKAMLRNVPTLTLKWGHLVENIHSFEDISRPTEQFYGFKIYYWSGSDSIGQVSFESRNAESVKLWVKALRTAGVPDIQDTQQDEPTPMVSNGGDRRSSIFSGRRKSQIPQVSTPGAALAGVAALGVAAALASRSDNRKSTMSMNSLTTVEGSAEDSSSIPNAPQPDTSRFSTQSVVSAGPAIAAAAGYVQLKFCFQEENYIVLLPHLPSIEQLKRLTHKTIKADFDRRGKDYSLTREGMLLKYRDDVGDLINVVDDNTLAMAYKYVTPNRLTIHILDASVDN